jgi:tagatose 1,6-diphosphate aldolase
MYNSLVRTTVGSIELRVGHTEEVDGWLGHIGYGVDPAYRGQRYAARSCRLLLPLACRHGLNPLWITCDPDNLASRRTCEILGAELVDIVAIPPGTFNHTAFEMMGETHKCRYRLALE